MKKAVSFILIISIALLLVFSLVACNNEDKIIGTWKYSTFDFSYGNNTSEISFDTEDTLTFNKDGTVTNTYGQTAYWKYNKTTKEYYIVDDVADFDNPDDRETAKFIDGTLHIDIFVYKKS